MKAGFWEILLILLLALILFGHSKIPDLAKNIANGINVFKKEMKSKKDGKSAGKDKKIKKDDSAKTSKPAVKPVKAKPKKK